jgi:hypothetical protein
MLMEEFERLCNKPVEVLLEPVYKNLLAALMKFKDSSMKMIKEANYDFSADAAFIKRHIKLVKEYKAGNRKGGVIKPAEKTIDFLDLYYENVDGYMNVGNGIMIQIFDLILRNKLTLADIKEYELFYRSVYLDLCEAVKKFYINVIEAIGKGYEHSMPMTKNIFGENLHVEKASGMTYTGSRIIDKAKFESKVVGQQSFDKDFKEEMEKFTSEQK